MNVCRKPLGETLIELLKEQNRMLAGAESCTGGGVSAGITAIAGSSQVFCGGVVSYTNEVKQNVLGVPAEILETYGAVSEECTAKMAEGAAKLCDADTAFSVSGIAGPGGGTEKTPVGTVCFGFFNRGKITTSTQHFFGDRSDVRRQANLYVLQTLVEMLQAEK